MFDISLWPVYRKFKLSYYVIGSIHERKSLVIVRFKIFAQKWLFKILGEHPEQSKTVQKLVLSGDSQPTTVTENG